MPSVIAFGAGRAGGVRKPIEVMWMTPKCPVCGAGSYKNGFSRSGRRVYKFKSKSCGKKFNDRAGTPFWHLKEEKDVLTAALLCVKYLLSTYQVSDLLGLFGVRVSPSSVGRWPQRFGQSAKKIAKRYRVKFSRIWHVDEKFTPHKRVPSKRWKREKQNHTSHKKQRLFASH